MDTIPDDPKYTFFNNPYHISQLIFWIRVSLFTSSKKHAYMPYVILTNTKHILISFIILDW